MTVAIAATTTAGIAAGNPALFERQVVVRPALWGGSPTSRPAAMSLEAREEALKRSEAELAGCHKQLAEALTGMPIGAR